MYIYDLIAILIIAVCHIFLYIKLIQYKRFSMKTMTIMSVIFTGLLIIIVTATNIPELNALLLLIFLLSLGLLQQKNGLSFSENLFFALISSVIITIARMVTIEVLFYLFMLSPLNLYRWTGSLIHLIAVCIIFITLIIWHKKITDAIRFIVNSNLYYVTYAILIITLFILLAIMTFSTGPFNPLHVTYSQMGYLMSVILFLLLLIIFIISSHLAKEQLVEEQETQLDNAMIDYIKKLEVLHDELASFRHDYMNVLVSLDHGVRSKDLEQIEEIYYKTIAPTSKIINHQELELVKLSRILMSAIKSVITVKTIEAQQQGITVSLDIPHKINRISMPLISFIRAISIVMDNAIEEVVKNDEKQLKIAFFETKNTQYFIVQNNLQQMINLQAIYERNYSRKGESRGYGLFSLKRLIEKTPHVMLETKHQEGYFSQILTIKKTVHED